MSVLIKGMEMPKDYEVKLTLFPNGQLFVDSGIYYLEYKAVEVPTPHGRLIDEDWLCRFISTNDSLGATRYGCLTKEEIQLAPTVIEREE